MSCDNNAIVVITPSELWLQREDGRHTRWVVATLDELWVDQMIRGYGSGCGHALCIAPILGGCANTR